MYENLAEWDKHLPIEDVLNERPFTFCEAGAEDPEGTYPIYIEGGYDDQYVFQYASGLLTIRDWADLVTLRTRRDGLENIPYLIYSTSGISGFITSSMVIFTD